MEENKFNLGKNMKIIKAEPQDLAEITAFEEKCFPCVTDRFAAKNILHQIKSKTCLILIVRDEEGKICALVTGFLRHFKQPSGRVYKIGVLPDFKRKGLGSKLLKKIENWFAENNMKRSYAEVRKSNKASRGMFLKNGYSEIGKLYCYYGNLNDSIELEDGVKYMKNL